MSDIPQNYTSESEITERFEDLDAMLNEEAEVVLIGGGAMTLKGIKAGTKDLDIVATSRESYRRVREALLDMGLEEIDHPEKSYGSLGAASVLEFGEDNRVDLFDRQVMVKLTVSGSMLDRCTREFSGENLDVLALAPVDIALFKSMTPRDDDITDVEQLLATGVDLEVYEGELENQLPVNTGFEAVNWIRRDKAHPVYQLEDTVDSLEGLPDSLIQLVKERARVVEAEIAIVDFLFTRGEAIRGELESEVPDVSTINNDQIGPAISSLMEKDVIKETDTGLITFDWEDD